MLVGVPREIKTHEYRVGLTPPAVAELVAAGAEVVVESRAGEGVDFADSDYVAAGARITSDPREAFSAELVVKVKEPQPHEIDWMKPGQTLFTYLHLAADRTQTEKLLASGVTAIAYETVTDARGALPLLRPMSEVAGRMAVQVGAHYLEKEAGGRGILLSGVPGVAPGRVVILGGGAAGLNAAQLAIGFRADVTIYDISTSRLAELDQMFEGRVRTAYASRAEIAEAVAQAHLVIGAVLVPGAATPKLVTRQMLKQMKRGSVLVDIAIDQGGCFETSRPTSHDAPIFVEEDIIHYCVSNMPGAVARTSTVALVNATLPFVTRLATLGTDAALTADPHLMKGLNIRSGRIMHPGVAEAFPDLPSGL